MGDIPVSNLIQMGSNNWMALTVSWQPLLSRPTGSSNSVNKTSSSSSFPSKCALAFNSSNRSSSTEDSSLPAVGSGQPVITVVGNPVTLPVTTPMLSLATPQARSNQSSPHPPLSNQSTGLIRRNVHGVKRYIRSSFEGKRVVAEDDLLLGIFDPLLMVTIGNKVWI